MTPASIVDKHRLLRNIERMSEKAESNNVALRPHIKTHKCLEIAQLQHDNGAKGFTVSTLAEARVFIDHGFDDLTLAIPIATGWIPTAVRLASKSNLKLLLDSRDVIEAVNLECKDHDTNVEVLMKVDCGSHRCGIDPSDPRSIELAQKIVDSSHLGFQGILTHAGHSYYAKTGADIQRMAAQEQDVMIDFAEKLRKRGGDLSPQTISIGSTPTMTYSGPIREGITEIRPGSYVFLDYHQVAIGSSTPLECAMTVLSSVLGNYGPHLVIDAGATALSKDRGPVHLFPDCGYGRIFTEYDDGGLAENTIIEGLSQEHGKVVVGPKSPLRNTRPGELVRILPNHSCLAANLSDSYYVVEGDTVVENWKVRNERELADLN
ncbi:MAG: alanine racemase [Candidatus Thorarchaeota archaeon]